MIRSVKIRQRRAREAAEAGHFHERIRGGKRRRIAARHATEGIDADGGRVSFVCVSFRARTVRVWHQMLG